MLFLVDLAGSEMVKKTHATGQVNMLSRVNVVLGHECRRRRRRRSDKTLVISSAGVIFFVFEPFNDRYHEVQRAAHSGVVNKTRPIVGLFLHLVSFRVLTYARVVRDGGAMEVCKSCEILRFSSQSW